MILPNFSSERQKFGGALLVSLSKKWWRRLLICNELVSCPRNKHIFRCDQNGPPARREEGAYLNRYVTDEQRGHRPIFIATLWAAVSWLFFRVARSSRPAPVLRCRHGEADP
jgi:hypothetical protein